MPATPRPLCIQHCTSQPFRFFGRAAELSVLTEAFQGGPASVVALVGPGGQGKTATIQEWLGRFVMGKLRADGVFLWSFYRGKDADQCLRELYAYASGLPYAVDLSASYCVEHLVPVLRRERWAVILDGAEVVQYDTGSWFGRFLHPELGRLIDELAGEPMPGLIVLTTRFPVPGLERRRHACVRELPGLDAASGRDLLTSLGVHGSPAELDMAAAAGGYHAKAVELLGTYLVRFQKGIAARAANLRHMPAPEDYSTEEQHVARILAALQQALAPETQDVLALATAFREPRTESHLLEYLASAPVRTLLHDSWDRTYEPFADRPAEWLGGQIQELVDLRLLERVGRPSDNPSAADNLVVMDAHLLVRRGFEHVLGGPARRQSAQTRAGFLRGRPNRRRANSLDQAREEVELFHAYCEAQLWNEADGVYVALDNPKHRFLAPAFERDLLLQFFADRDWRRPPRWPGFGRYRSLAICFELLGQFEDALEAYRGPDQALRGDALLALGRLQPLLDQEQVQHPWQNLWQAYRAHALCLAGRLDEAAALARALVPVDVYEWLHVFECLLRVGQLQAVDLQSLLSIAPQANGQQWAELARQRMRADYLRATVVPVPGDLGTEYKTVIEEYDRAGLPYERALARLGYARWLMSQGNPAQAEIVNAVTLDLARRYGMDVVTADAWEIEADVAHEGDMDHRQKATQEAARIRKEKGYQGPRRP
jgi:hypothetical protein